MEKNPSGIPSNDNIPPNDEEKINFDALSQTGEPEYDNTLDAEIHDATKRLKKEGDDAND